MAFPWGGNLWIKPECLPQLPTFTNLYQPPATNSNKNAKVLVAAVAPAWQWRLPAQSLLLCARPVAFRRGRLREVVWVENASER